jgi:hypothetical protein
VPWKVGELTWLRSLWKAALIVVAVGVALMHSTGHACTGAACHTETASVATVAEGHAADGEDGHEHPMGTGMSPVQVCMAILTGLAIAVSLWAVRRLAPIADDDPTATRRRAGSWAPPVALPSGGRLSHLELSVLRI